jgi:hypothetical protein
LARQVVRHGRLLADVNPSRRIAFLALLPSRWDDLRIARKVVDRKILVRMAGG